MVFSWLLDAAGVCRRLPRSGGRAVAGKLAGDSGVERRIGKLCLTVSVGLLLARSHRTVPLVAAVIGQAVQARTAGAGRGAGEQPCALAPYAPAVGDHVDLEQANGKCTA